MTISHGPRTRSMTVDPGVAVPASNISRLAWMAFSLSSRSLRFSVTVSRSRRACRRRGEVAALVKQLRRRSPELAARRARYGAARHQHDVVDHEPANIDDPTANGVRQFACRHCATRFGDD